jgi:hypothetical protein
MNFGNKKFSHQIKEICEFEGKLSIIFIASSKLIFHDVFSLLVQEMQKEQLKLQFRVNSHIIVILSIFFN